MTYRDAAIVGRTRGAGWRQAGSVSRRPVGADVARCRAGMAELVTQAVATTRKLERRLDVTGGWREASARIDFDDDPTAAFRITGALLLRKARIHTDAVLRANGANNLHSLAVQMRPILECAGQAVFIFQTTIIAPDLLMSPESALAAFGDRLNADYYQTFRRITRGEISPEELRETATEAQAAAAASVGAAKPKSQKSWSLRQADKMTTLPRGREWYNYLSEHFSHATAAEWRGLPWRGAVISMDTVQDQFAFLGFMDYLVDQVARMNAAVALCPVAGEAGDQWDRWVAPALAQQRDMRESSRTLVDAAITALTRERDGNARTG